MSVDSRIAQMRALVDDARTLGVEVLNEVDCPALAEFRQYMNWGLSALERAEALLELIGRCPDRALTGGRCVLTTGHAPPHQGVASGGRRYTWTDESVKRGMDQHGSRFD